MPPTLKKCIVLDLDNTLWGGIVGEDGLDGIKLGLTPPGSNFLAFQQALLDLYNRGIILAVNSRNNFDDAVAVLRTHPNMVLKEHHFAAMRINWNDKSENLRELARELNIGFDSMVFLDDDPANRALVLTTIPEIEVPDFPEDAGALVKFLQSLPYFKTGVITDEDKMRGSFYVTERLRKEHEKKFSSREEFLRSLGTEVHCFVDDPSAAARLSQMTGKTNQFNANMLPMTEEEIKRFIADDRYGVFYASARDRFGDHGIIAFALVRKGSPLWTIESFLGSCRILGRGIEEAFLEAIRRHAAESGASQIKIEFKPTKKNQPAKGFVDKYFMNYLFSVSAGDMTPSGVRLEIHTGHGKT